MRETDANPAAATAPSGLTTEEAAHLLAKFGPNSVAEEREHPLRVLWSKFWAPVPWMLEAAVVLEILLHKNIEAGVDRGTPRVQRGPELHSCLLVLCSRIHSW